MSRYKHNNQIYNTLLHNNMEITVGKQALYMRGRRKWVKETKIGCGQNLVALGRGGKISVPRSQKIWCHGSTANFTTPPHENNTTPHITWWIINCDFKRWKQIFISLSPHCRNGGYHLHPSVPFFSFYQQGITLFSPKLS